jgi:hypothetical protein
MPLGLPQQFTTVDWDNIPVTEHLGDSGAAYWKTQQYEGVRVRMVRYSPGYLADHWCERGHLLFVLSGTLITEVKGAQTVTLTAGQSYVVADGASSHRSRTTNGATLFIVD